MNATLELTDTAATPADAAPNIVIIYQDRATGLRAKHFADMLASELGDEANCTMAFWRCELIELPEIASDIARDAAASEFVILALRGDTALSFAARHFIESWLACASGGIASLVALFDPACSRRRFAEGVRWYLRQAAAEAGVAFFAHSTDHSQDRINSAPERSAVESTRRGRRQGPRMPLSLAPFAA